MANHGHGLPAGKKASRRILAAALFTCAVVLSIEFFSTGAGAIDIPPAVVKKSVMLKQGYQEAGRVFKARCGLCHAVPDPVQQRCAKTECTQGISKNDLAAVQRYVAGARTGKILYESRCVRCHDLIEPGSHTAEYWSHNLCSSEECFVKPLSEEEEQQLLLYLSSHAKKSNRNRSSMD